MATKTAAKPGKTPTKRMGRPPKASAAAERVLAVRFTETDRGLLAAIIEDEKRREVERGSMSSGPTIGDVIRALVRQEAERRGLSSAA